MARPRSRPPGGCARTSIVMDIRMPVMDGIEATRRIVARRRAARARVLVLTTFDADENVVQALRAGASGFLLKDVPPADFVAAIRIVAAGDALLAPARHAPAPGPVRRPPARRSTTPGTTGFRELTERELEVLKLVARGLSNREIAERLGPRRADGQDPRLARPPQARPARPGAGGRAGLRGRAGPPGRRRGLTAASPTATDG